MARTGLVTLPSRAKGAAPSPVLLVLLAILSVQFGGAMAATLLPLIGVTGSVTLRLVLAVALLLLFARPRVRGYTRSDWITVISFGVSLAAMNTAFYGSLTRLPIGVAVTIEFVGPLLLAATLSRRLRDFSPSSLPPWGCSSSARCSTPRPTRSTPSVCCWR